MVPRSGTGTPGARGARRWIALGVAAATLVAGGTVVLLTRDGGVVLPADLPSAGIPASRVCGVADPGRFAALAATAPTVEVSALVADLAAEGGGEPVGLEANGTHVATMAHDDTRAVITTWSSSGAATSVVTVTAPAAGRVPDTFALAADGAVVTLTGSADGRTVASWSDGADPDVQWDVGSADTGRVIDVLAWTGDDGDAVASVVFEKSQRLALLHADGTVVDGPELAWDWYPRFWPQEDGSLFVLSDTDGDAGYTTLTRYDAAGAVLMRIGGTKTQPSENGRPQTLEHPTGVAAAPDGDGYLLSGPTWRVVEIGPDGVWRHVALSGEGQGSTFRLVDGTPLLRAADAYYFLSPADSPDGAVQLSHVPAADLRTLLDAPVTWNVSTATTTDRLGYGAGLVTDAALDYFPAGTTPAVAATFDPWWGQVADDYELRYEVTGDPALRPAVTPGTGTVAIPADGGEVPLTLPDARPGPYQVHAELVEKATGAVRTATCLRYAVGAPGAAFDPDGLADGADWGGAGPLRGVQLAAELGLGTHRVQLDFGGLVPPGGTPSVAALDLSALPGAADDDPFAGLAAAAAAALERGVNLYVQVGEAGDRAQQAVADGTWEAWVSAIVTAVRTGAPDITLWAPWNEPNNTGFGDGADYVRQVLAPFARAVHAVDPRARVIGGNALNVVVPWYSQAVGAGACDAWDIVGIHPYTGLNRSWDEEGDAGPIGQITELRDVLATCGNHPPVWNTESGWWSDGPANEWGQAADIARTSLWQSELGVSAWMYFFSEGGWGEGGFTWSLIQVGSFVKPGALAMSTTSGLLAGRPAAQRVAVDDPTVRVMRLGPSSAADGTPARSASATPSASAAPSPSAAPSASDPLLAVWTLDADTDVALTATADTAVTVTDLYGGTRTVRVAAGAPTTLPVTGAPQFLSAPESAGLTVAAAEPGTNVVADGTATASSTSEGDAGDLLLPAGAAASPWRAGPTTGGAPDVSPWVRVDLARATTIDRVVVGSAGIRCCTAGLRDAVIEVRTADDTWQQVGRLTGLFGERTATVRFGPVKATAVRVTVPTTTQRDVTIPSANYSGQIGGLLPAWEPVRAEPTWPVSLVSLAAYGPS